jgi:hypothetical protein
MTISITLCEGKFFVDYIFSNLINHFNIIYNHNKFVMISLIITLIYYINTKIVYFKIHKASTVLRCYLNHLFK